MGPDLGSQLLSTHQGCRCSFSVPDTGPEQLKDLGKYQLVPLVQLWSKFSPKMLSAGISVPRFTVAGRGLPPPTDTRWDRATVCPGYPQQLGSVPAVWQCRWVFTWCNRTEAGRGR